MKLRKPIPFEFVLDQLESMGPIVRPMFGCHAIYIGERIVLILREKSVHPRDNGVWLATSSEHHESLQKAFPRMRSIELLGSSPTNWQNLPADTSEFEKDVELVCRLVRMGDRRIGKIPKKRSRRKSKL